MTDPYTRAALTCVEALQDLRQLWLEAFARYQKADNFIHSQIDLLMSWQMACDTEIEERVRVQKELEAVQKQNIDLQGQLKAVQKEAQLTREMFSQEQLISRSTIQTQTDRYNKLSEKYAVLKASVATTDTNTDTDGNASGPKTKLTRNPIGESEIILDKNQAKARLVELAKQGLNADEIAQRLYNEGYRTKGRFDGKVKTYIDGNIKTWWTKWKETGSL